MVELFVCSTWSWVKNSMVGLTTMQSIHNNKMMCSWYKISAGLESQTLAKPLWGCQHHWVCSSTFAVLTLWQFLWLSFSPKHHSSQRDSFRNVTADWVQRWGELLPSQARWTYLLTLLMRSDGSLQSFCSWPLPLNEYIIRNFDLGIVLSLW